MHDFSLLLYSKYDLSVHSPYDDVFTRFGAAAGATAAAAAGGPGALEVAIWSAIRSLLMPPFGSCFKKVLARNITPSRWIHRSRAL